MRAQIYNNIVMLIVRGKNTFLYIDIKKFCLNLKSFTL